MNEVPPHDASPLEAPADAEALFVAFVRHRDVACPRCDYSVRNAARAICSECGEPLRLNVGLERPIVGALLAAAVPCMGCGICGMILILLIMLMPGAPAGFVLTTLAMLCSGAAGLAILLARRRFIRQSRQRQRMWAIASIVLNTLIVAALIAFVVYDR